ncbi:hypothetical protein I4U23_020233 [Adineta vaga]|nr:hypothetical protein I4U23_020233 [Adineta vaga]
MDYKDQELVIACVSDSLLQVRSDEICTVCGTQKAIMHYGALCCESCKIFFRRNAQYDLSNNQCVFASQCDVTIHSRRACRYCRLKKCLSVGMQRELLRAAHQKRKTRTLEKKQSSYVIYPLDLLQNDRSLLNSEQWNNLSNIINVYAIKSPIPYIRQLLKTQSTHPMKLRIKMAMSNILDIISSMYLSLSPLIDIISQFSSLSINDRSILIERNMKSTCGFIGISIFRETDAYHSVAFKFGFPAIYGSIVMEEGLKIYERIDNDGTLIKLFLPILIFSTGCEDVSSIIEAIIQNNLPQDQFNLLSNNMNVFYLQNLYVEILFKYMNYRYGYNEAALRFAALLKCFLDQSICALLVEDNQRHTEFIQTVVQETKCLLSLENDQVIV